MVEEEFKSNQTFMYPEEYDIYKQDVEQGLKRAFTAKPPGIGDKSIRWKVPNFEKEKTIIESFKKKDMYEKKNYEEYLKKEAVKEKKLEQFIWKQAIEYHNFMTTRHTQKEKKTLRTVLAENYQAMLKAHGATAEARFPHTAYGQDKNSETFKKSFPGSYKNYFFKLVKNIVTTKNGKKTVNRKPPSMLLSAGAKTSTKNDHLIK